MRPDGVQDSVQDGVHPGRAGGLSGGRPGPENRKQTRRLALRQGPEGLVAFYASNDAEVDAHKSVITVEGLHDWWQGYKQHRTLSLQHNLSLRGIEGRPQVGLALRADFTPQLMVEARLDAPDVRRMVASGRLAGGSLEFVPLPEGTEVVEVDGAEVEVYHRLSAEPELCGLTLCDIPSVPGAQVVSYRGAGRSEQGAFLPNWMFAVIDPAVLNGQVEGAALIERLRWFAHHDLDTRLPDEAAVRAALEALESGDISVPPEATLTPEQVAERAVAHLQRHTPRQFSFSSDAPAGAERTTMNGWMTRRRAGAEPEGAESPETLESATASGGGPVGETVKENDGNESKALSAQLSAQLTNRVAQAVDAHPAIRSLMSQAETPQAAFSSGFRGGARPKSRLAGERLLSEVLARTIVPQLQFRSLDSAEVERAFNMLRAHGISERALSIEANGTVIRDELARQFAVKPYPEAIARNLLTSVPMAGVRKLDYPRFDRGGLSFQWNRSSAIAGAGGSTSAVTASDPVADTFVLESSELNGATVIPDSFLSFNAQGAGFVSETLLPQMRSAAQFEEDRQVFLSSGAHPDPATFSGIDVVAGVTAVTPGANGDPFSLSLLGSLLRAMPKNYRAERSRLAYFVSTRVADDFEEIIANRATALGDAFLTGEAEAGGLRPVGYYRRVPVFEVVHKPENQVQGTSTDASTVTLVHLDVPVIGDALSLKMEPLRQEGFVTKLQLQEFVGLGYQFTEAVVRRAGVLPAV